MRSFLLFVESNPVHAALLTAASMRAGLNASSFALCRDGFEAIAYMEQHGKRNDAAAPGRVILTLDFPVLDVLAWMKANPPFHELPITLITASNDLATLDDTDSLGASEFIERPRGFENLVLQVRRWRGECAGQA